MPELAPASERVELRCHSCSHGVGYSAAAMRFVAMFKASLFGRLPAAAEGEVRRRCAHCGWVNVFHPLTGSRERHTVEVKVGP